MYQHLSVVVLVTAVSCCVHASCQPAGSESDQTVQLGEFTASNYMSVSNMMGARGLEQLGEMLSKAGSAYHTNATQFLAEATSLREAIVKHMWNGTAFCDGICTDVKDASLVMTNMFGLALGQVSPQGTPAIDTAWATTASWGIVSVVWLPASSLSLIHI